jgi:hypothetical protein
MSGFQLSLHAAKADKVSPTGGALRPATLDKCRGRGRRQRTLTSLRSLSFLGKTCILGLDSCQCLGKLV